jgi:hypothetical protein
MVTTSSQSSPSMQLAESKLDAALTRLERTLDARSVSSGRSDRLNDELDLMKAEILQLKKINQVISSRLGGAIERLKKVLER